MAVSNTPVQMRRRFDVNFADIAYAPRLCERNLTGLGTYLLSTWARKLPLQLPGSLAGGALSEICPFTTLTG